MSSPLNSSVTAESILKGEHAQYEEQHILSFRLNFGF